MLTAFHDKQRTILEALSLAIESHWSTPIILPPGMLLYELQQIKTKISGKNLDLLLPVSKDSMSYYYQLAETRSRILNNQ